MKGILDKLQYKMFEYLARASGLVDFLESQGIPLDQYYRQLVSLTKMSRAGAHPIGETCPWPAASMGQDTDAGQHHQAV